MSNRTGRMIDVADDFGTYEGIDDSDPFWQGYYDALEPNSVTRPIHAAEHYGTSEDANRWRAGAMLAHRERRQRESS